MLKRCRRIARRLGRLKARGQLGEPTRKALRLAIMIAVGSGCQNEDIDYYCGEGVHQGQQAAKGNET